MAENETIALAVYGSLAPGEKNHWVISRIKGDWITGTVLGYQFDITWGPADGYDGFLPDPGGGHVPVHVLMTDESELAKKWREIDDFEGPGYERQTIDVTLEDGTALSAFIYVALTDI